MEEPKKLYSQKAISITTFFGGPLAAGILMRQNFLNIEKEKQGTNALFIGIVTTILLFGGLLALPEHIIDKIPNAIIPAIYAGVIYLIVEKTQGKELKSHKENNGEFYSAWKAAKIGAISLIAILFTIASVAFIAGDLSNTEPNFDAEAYDNGLSKFFENEELTIKVFQHFETGDVDYIIKEVNKNLILWKENRLIIDRIDKINNLPEELRIQNSKLRTYCDLRIEHFDLILKTFIEDTDKYSSQIQVIGQKIDLIIEELI